MLECITWNEMKWNVRMLVLLMILLDGEFNMNLSWFLKDLNCDTLKFDKLK